MSLPLKKYPNSRKNNIVIQELNDEILVYDCNTNKAYCLNETSSLIWQLCNGTNSISDMSRILGRKLKINISDDVIWLALDEFKRNDLLDKPEECDINFSRSTRREVIRKIGFASLVALPVMSSVIAPNAVSAQSLIAFGLSCTTDSQCVTGNCSDVNPVFPQSCCVPGNSIARPPGTPRACAATQAVCNLLPDVVNSCCSGSATLSSTACPGGFNCVCD